MLSAESAAAPGPSAIVSLFWIVAIAVVAPLAARLLRGYVPSVVLLLLLGMLLGPNMAGWAVSAGGVDLISELGLGMLFLLAGYELNPQLLRGKPGRVAWATWLISLLIAVGFIALAARDASFTEQVAVAIALTSTALGTLLPILKQDGLLEKPLGRAVLAHGAVGELGPVVAMSVLLTSRSPLAAIVVLLLFVVAALAVALVPRRLVERMPAVGRTITALEGGTDQLPVRVVFLLLLALMAVAESFDLDVVLGAFAAGVILRSLVAETYPEIETALETVGYGLLIPVFFVVSGMGIDPRAVAGNPLLWLVFVAAIAIARGLPVLVSERYVPHGANLDDGAERVELALYAATGMPIIVAVTEAATHAGLMDQRLASILVAAGGTTVLLFPLAAKGISAVAARR
ncbi:cation:proton antiporter [Nocardia huaxiensis]|uniref:Cation:proton antiporter n=1 Tax=Nocardia huaxiensis TaxID=2755382 RepID=A0A7D6VG32_9NOCA|nr:cation:proton antiporter [Nocardia huaxiensis]QLY34273.1 cation:proton antiporter [Nocardia huaxiensis]